MGCFFCVGILGLDEMDQGIAQSSACPTFLICANFSWVGPTRFTNLSRFFEFEFPSVDSSGTKTFAFDL